uniref:Uncharacterized protein n=1 Tax=Rhizophora mucronata TaxID=61149 RepID=A0A2P2N2P9_RHIMU
MQKLNPSLQHLNPPPQEFLLLLVVSKNPIIHFFVSENTVSIVTNGMALFVITVHVSDHTFELLKPQVLFNNIVRSKLLSPGQALLQHVKRFRDSKVSSSQELQQDDVGFVIPA